MKDSLPRQLWIGLSIIFVSIVLGIVGLILVLHDVSNRAEAIQSDQVTIALQNGNVGLLVSLEKDAVASVPYQTAINQLLPTEDQLLQFPEAMQTIGQTFNVTVRASFTGDPTQTTPTGGGSVPFSMTATGQSSNLIAFLKDIESQSDQFLLAVTSVSFKTTPDSATQLSFSGNVFFR